MSISHTPAHTVEFPDQFVDESTGRGYQVAQDSDAEDPRTWIHNEHAALWAFREPRLGHSVAADMPEGNVAIDAFARYWEIYDSAQSLVLTRRYLAAFHTEKNISVDIALIRGYSQSDWLDVVAATVDGYGTPADHIDEFRMWAFGDVWSVQPDHGDSVGNIYADSPEEALSQYFAESADQNGQPQSDDNQKTKAASDDSNDFVVVRGGLVTNEPTLPVFDLDVVDDSDYAGDELIDLYERICAHIDARTALSDILDDIRRQVRVHGTPEDLEVLDAAQATANTTTTEGA